MCSDFFAKYSTQRALGRSPQSLGAIRGLLEKFAFSVYPRAPEAAPCDQLAQESLLLPSQLSPEHNHSHALSAKGDFKVGRASSHPLLSPSTHLP